MDRVSLESVRSMLTESQNPFFLYDNDVDGLCSFVLLRRWLGRGEGQVVKTYPFVAASYIDHALTAGSDLIVLLDRAVVGDSFFEYAQTKGIPVVWIDHHDVSLPEGTYSYYNPLPSKQVPVTYLSYSLSGKTSDQWIAVMGCLADRHIPDFYEDFLRYFPNLARRADDAFKVYYTYEIGRLARALAFCMKDIPSHITILEQFLFTCQSPESLAAELDSDSPIGVRYREVSLLYRALLEKAPVSREGVLFFTYGGTFRISAELANELSYRNPSVIVAVGYTRDVMASFSLRGKGVRGLIESILPLFPGASGGGHQDAVGIRIASSDVPAFEDELRAALSRSSVHI